MKFEIDEWSVGNIFFITVESQLDSTNDDIFVVICINGSRSSNLPSVEWELFSIINTVGRISNLGLCFWFWAFAISISWDSGFNWLDANVDQVKIN